VLSILDIEYNRGVDASIEETKSVIRGLHGMGAEFEKGEFNWVSSQVDRLNELIGYLERLKRCDSHGR
jgi:hypothetical protein